MKLARLVFKLALGERAPTHAGDIAVSGVSAPVRIRRDRWGIPQIEAENDDDAWFALGFCHAQDRAGQLEITLRAVRGCVAEVAGEDALAIDRLSRRIGWRRAAVAQLAAAPAHTAAQLRAYARGVNEGMRKGAKKRAHDLVLLATEPTPWEAEDVQGLCGLLCFALASNWDIELVRLAILEKDGADALAALDPHYPESLPVTHPPTGLASRDAEALFHDLRAFQSAMGGGASNAWVVAGGRTTSGRPILANDPHLQPNLPNPFYLARIRTPAWSVAGATFVGIPAFPSGHNGHAAWGLTAAHGDNTDLFLERVGPDGKSVEQDGVFVPCPVRTEVIKVKGKPDVVEQVLETPRGPMIGPAIGDGRWSLSLAGTWLQPRPYEGFLSMQRAHSPDVMHELFARCSTSSANIVYADVNGAIAWHFAMDVPIRKKGFGHLPSPGWDSSFGWEADGVPWNERPYAVDPPAGFFVNANNQPVPHGDSEHFLGVDWLDGYRAAAITEALQERPKWDVPSTLALQLDTRSLVWRDLKEAVLSTQTADADAQEALRWLREWDGNVGADSVGAAVFELFVSDLVCRVVRAKAPNSAEEALGAGMTKLLPHNLVVMRRMSHVARLVREQPAGWFAGGFGAEIAKSLAAAVRTLREKRGSSDRWAWGAARPLWMKHPIGEKWPMGTIYDRGPFASCGDAGTIPQGSVDPLDPLGNPIGLPVFRMVIDVGAWDDCRYILMGGQSGNPVSADYDAMTPLWEKGEAVPIPWTEDAVAKATVSTLTLQRG